jgi:uncharacterized repeat protein (TIGR03803 family)
VALTIRALLTAAFSAWLCTPALAQPTIEALHQMSVPDGTYPSRLVEGSDGYFYGAAQYYGSYSSGTVFRVSRTGDYVVLHHFTGWLDGGGPSGALVEAADGHFYGTTCWGGTLNNGTLFRLKRDGTLETVLNFGGDNWCSRSTLLAGLDGQLYGSAQGGLFNEGLIYRVTLTGSMTNLYHFRGGATDGASPAGDMVQAPDGRLFGTTRRGGTTGLGTIFQMTADNRVTVLRSIFLLDGDYSPISTPGPLPGADGHFYLTTPAHWKGRLSELFRITSAGEVTLLREFNFYEGAPIGSLRQGQDGYFYGTFNFYRNLEIQRFLARISVDGPIQLLTRVWPKYGWAYELRHALLQSRDGHFYGTNDGNGCCPLGPAMVFRLRVAPDAPTRVIPLTEAGGVRLTWASVVGATSYTIRRGLAHGQHAVLATGLTTSSYVDAAVTSGQRYFYTVTALNALGDSVASYEVSISPGRGTVADFTADRRSDLVVYRPGTGEWFVRDGSGATAPSRRFVWGASTDVPVIGDFDGDGRSDLAAFRSNGEWHIRYSSRDYAAGDVFVWGGTPDVPLSADFDGDGRIDVAVWRGDPSWLTSFWYIRLSSTNFLVSRAYRFGRHDDVPVVGDFDGDGRSELTMFRPSTGEWLIAYSSTEYTVPVSTTWGMAGDVPLGGDFDGDGRSEIAIYRPGGTWLIAFSSLGYRESASFQWGTAGDRPIVGDYDGDGRTDLTVYRPSTGQWFTAYSSTDYTTSASVYWGAAGDNPLP